MTTVGIRCKGVRLRQKWPLPALAMLCLVLLSGPARAQDKEPPRGAKANVTISTRNMPLAEFLELLSVSCKLNMVCPKDIAGNVSANFYEVPAKDVLQAVLEANGYEYTVDKTSGRDIIKIKKAAPPKPKVAPKIVPKVPAEPELVVQTYLLKYATASDVDKVVRALLSKSGKSTVAEGRNALIVQDTARSLKDLGKVVELLDAAPRQVMIDARIIELGRTNLEERGFNWSMFQSMKIADITAEAAYAREATWVTTKVSGAADTDTRNIVKTTGTLLDLRAGVLAENAARLVLDFFDTLTDTTIISSPSIRTLDNKAAHIISGQIVPIPLFDFAKDTGVRTLSGFQDEQIGVELTVTPHINEDGYITLDINPKVENIDRFIQVDGDDQRPVKNTRQAKTTIRIKDGETAVIAGLTASTNIITRTGLPVLRDLPLIGWLFRSYKKDVQTTELIIFITPRIVKDGREHLTKAQRDLLKKANTAKIIQNKENNPSETPETQAPKAAGLTAP